MSPDSGKTTVSYSGNLMSLGGNSKSERHFIIEDVEFYRLRRGDVIFYPTAVGNFFGRVVERSGVNSFVTASDFGVNRDTTPLTPSFNPKLVVARIDAQGRQHAVARGGAGMMRFHLCRIWTWMIRRFVPTMLYLFFAAPLRGLVSARDLHRIVNDEGEILYYSIWLIAIRPPGGRWCIIKHRWKWLFTESELELRYPRDTGE